ncbi:MAG TPA: nicotinate (nicotinamide) nucleotide adenylyltransferase [Terriglobales bacterium]|nr:nicotinate (nicotinamide) nucleotide adenylyltransferase [Terriglobales bacterium]
MNIGLFGGTFDPVHRGHLAVAHAAAKKFRLGQVLFVPSSVPPHRVGRPLSPYHHRFAMLTLALQREKSFIPSSLEAPPEPGVLAFSSGRHGPGFSYSIDTVRALKMQLGKSDQLFFLIGIDAFMDIAKWHEPEALLRELDFIVASRPGYSLADVAGALPESLRPDEKVIKAFKKAKAAGTLALGATAIHLLPDVNVRLSATQVRTAAERGKPLGSLVDPAVAEYIRKTRLYRRASEKQRPARKTRIL